VIAIVTDSTAYLTHDEAVELGVVVVPMSYSLDGVMSLSEGCIENDDAAEKLAENLQRNFPVVLIRPVGPVLGIHLGVGAIGVSWNE
jgi:fatty acid-binding protein DegV